MEIGSIPNLIKDAEELNAPDPIKQLQEEWAEELSDKFIEDEERKQKSNESCRTCKYIRQLWWWKDYPRDKQYGWCCYVLGDVVMQLYNIDRPGDICEMYDRRAEQEF